MDEAVDPAQLAATCVDYVKRAVGLELDYTQDTLPVLDHYIREAARNAGQGDRAALLGPLLPTAGAYFGQLAVTRLAGARFVTRGQDYANYRVEFAPFFLHFNPLGIAQEVLACADAPGWHAHFAVLDEAQAVVEQSLAQGLSMRDQDYYSFSVRYETLEQVAATVSALEEQRKGPARHFPTEVYEAAIGKLAAAKG